MKIFDLTIILKISPPSTGTFPLNPSKFSEKSLKTYVQHLYLQTNLDKQPEHQQMPQIHTTKLPVNVVGKFSKNLQIFPPTRFPQSHNPQPAFPELPPGTPRRIRPRPSPLCPSWKVSSPDRPSRSPHRTERDVATERGRISRRDWSSSHWANTARRTAALKEWKRRMEMVKPALGARGRFSAGNLAILFRILGWNWGFCLELGGLRFFWNFW